MIDTQLGRSRAVSANRPYKRTDWAMSVPPCASNQRHFTATQQRWVIVLAALMLLLSLSACETIVPAESSEGGDAEVAADESAVDASDTLTTVQPLDPADAAAPVRLQIPAIGLDVPVAPMGWRVVTVEGERTTAWDVPLDAVGWHAGSPGAGTAGNVLLSGRQADGDALLSPLALGSVVPGQDVILTDENGVDFVYRVREVSKPIPISGVTEEEQASAFAYLAETDGAQLTLITGWPEFTTTHRIFAVADLVETPQ